MRPGVRVSRDDAGAVNELVTDGRAAALVEPRHDVGHHRDWGCDDPVAACAEGRALRLVWGPVLR